MTLRMPEYVVCNDGHGQQNRRGHERERNDRPHDGVKEHELDAGRSVGHESAAFNEWSARMLVGSLRRHQRAGRRPRPSHIGDEAIG